MSLTKLAVQTGFEVEFVRESETNDYLEMLVRKSKKELEGRFNDRLQVDKAKLKEYVAVYNNVSIWGASYVARSCVEFFEPEEIKHFYDVSEIKVGKYISDFFKVIEKPDKDSVNGNDLIIIMANEYTKDILASLKMFGYGGKIIGFDSAGYITEIKM